MKGKKSAYYYPVKFLHLLTQGKRRMRIEKAVKKGWLLNFMDDLTDKNSEMIANLVKSAKNIDPSIELKNKKIR